MGRTFEEILSNSSDTKNKKNKTKHLFGTKIDITKFVIYLIMFGLGFAILVIFLFAFSNHPSHVLLRGEGR